LSNPFHWWLHLGKQFSAFFFGEHRGQPSRTRRPNKIAELTQIPVQHLAIEKNHRIEGLILRAGCDMTFAGQVAQKLFDLLLSAIAWMTPSIRRWCVSQRIRGAIATETNEAMDPIDVSLFGAIRVMPKAKRFAALIQ